MDESKYLIFYPFAYALLDEYLEDFCWYCLKERTNDDTSIENEEIIRLLRCSGCKTAYFCSKLCQTKGWSDHKAECKSISKLKLENENCSIPNIETRMLGRLVWRYKQILDGHDKKDKEFYLNRTSVRNVMDLCSHDNDMRADKKAWRKFQDILRGLREFYESKFVLDDETIFQLHCRNFINRHGISDRTYLREIGKGLYLDLCWYDHSCRPNSLYTHNGFISILRPLSNNVQLADRSKTFYTYIDLLQSKEERQRALLDSWYFDCRCDRCIDETDHLLTAIKCSNCQSAITIFRESQLKSILDHFVCDNCGQLVDENRFQKAIMTMRKIDTMVNEDDQLSIDNENRLKLIDDRLKEFSDLLPLSNIFLVRLLRTGILRSDPNDADRLVRYHLQALDCMRICYPNNHPSLAYHLMNIGIFYGRLKNIKEARKFLIEAKGMFEFTLGTDHFLTNTACGELEKLK